MKWVGQQIYDFISRFRNDVYLEDISTGTIASGGNLGLDANNKIVKADTEAGELTIANAADNRVITSLGGTDLNAEANLTWDGDDLNITSSLASRPKVTLTNTNVSSKGPNIFLVNDKGAAGALNDEAGTITFKSDNASQSLKDYGSIAVKAIGVIPGDEAGTLVLSTASSNGSSTNLRNVITGTGSVSADTVNIDIGYGTSSMCTIAGNATIGGDQILITGSSTQSSRIKFFEDTDNGTNSTVLASAEAMSSDKTITLPDATGTVLLKDNVNPGKQFQVFQTNFTDDLNTSEVFIPLHGSTFEQTSQFADDVAILAPCDGRIVSLDLNILAVTGSGDLTVYSCPPGIPGIFLTDWTEEENEVISIQDTDDSHVFHFAFDNAKHFESTEKFALSIQSSADIMGNTLIYATAVVEFDYSTLLPATSAEFDSAP